MLKIGDKIQCISPFINTNGIAFYHNVVFTISLINQFTDSLNLIEPGRIGCVGITREELIRYFKSYPIIANTTNDNKSDDLDDALGLPTGASAQHVPWGGHIFTVPATGNYKIDTSDWTTFVPTFNSLGNADIFTTKKCTCGSLKTFGESCMPEFHSSWCDMGKK